MLNRQPMLCIKVKVSNKKFFLDLNKNKIKKKKKKQLCRQLQIFVWSEEPSEYSDLVSISLSWNTNREKKGRLITLKDMGTPHK